MRIWTSPHAALVALLSVSAGLWSSQTAKSADLNFTTPAESALWLHTFQPDVPPGERFPVYGSYLELAPRVLTDEQTGDVLVPWASQLYLNVQLPLTKAVELELQLPILLYQAVDVPDAFGPVAAQGLGDVRLGLNLPLFQRLPRQEGLLDLQLAAYLPLGTASTFRGGEQLRPEVGVRVSHLFSKLQVSSGLHYRHLPAAEFVAATSYRDTYLWRLSAQAPTSLNLDAFAELRGLVLRPVDAMETGTAGAELLLGAQRLVKPTLTLQAGLALELGDSPILPTARLWLGLKRLPLPSLPQDDDQDGLLNLQDRCPEQAEDRDTFQDEDGCPELDNDNDAFPDASDDCPNEPGAEKGCPSRDLDRDGQPDATDRCVDQAEDADGYQDDDGCPDPDNDGDGVLDTGDRCPLQKEDLDRFQDTDGCPEEDNDGDALKDLDDQCPDEPETFNGLNDADGCPDVGRVDSGAPAIGTRLVLGERIEFAKNSDRVPDEAVPQLEQLSQLLQRYPSLRLRIEVHTDTKGSAEHNLSLSRRRAERLRQRLLELFPGADNRVEALGRGESAPLMTDDSDTAHQTNRRVEVLVVP